MKRFLCTVWLACLACGCQTPAKLMPQIQLKSQPQPAQSQSLAAGKRATFDALVSVLQDYGYVLVAADYDAGFLYGLAATTSKLDCCYGVINRGSSVSATVTEAPGAQTQVRLTFVASIKRKSMWDRLSDVLTDTLITDPEVYQAVFGRVREAVSGLTAKP